MKLFSLAIASAAFPIKLVILECLEAKFIGNQLCWSHVLIKFNRPETFSKRDSSTGVFQWILQNFKNISGQLLLNVNWCKASYSKCARLPHQRLPGMNTKFNKIVQFFFTKYFGFLSSTSLRNGQVAKKLSKKLHSNILGKYK